MMRALLICTATGLLVSGCAAAPTTPKTAAATPANTAANCVGQTSASRIPQSSCGPGRSFTQDDIRTTGQPTAAGALPMLDPAIHR